MLQSVWFEVINKLVNFSQVISIFKDYDAIQLKLTTTNEPIYFQYDNHEDMIEDYDTLVEMLTILQDNDNQS